MIEFTREDNKVIIHLKHNVFYDNESFSLVINQSYAYQAELLKRKLREEMERKLKNMKETYYKKGWKDARTRGITKKENFYGNWE